MSLDGYVAGPNQSEEHPLGEGGMALHEWVFALEAWRARPRPRGRRGQRLDPGRGGDAAERRRDDHGPQHVRRHPRRVGRAPVGRLVGRGPALPRAGLRAHAPRARAARDAGRHDVSLRHRRHRVRVEQARAAAGEGKDITIGGGASADPAVPRGRARRRADAERRADLPRRRRRACSTAYATRTSTSNAPA